MLKKALSVVTCFCVALTASISIADDHTKVLKADVGVWDAKVKAWMAGPDQDPDESTAVEKNRMIGDNWLVSDFKGNFGGMDFTGHMVMGYDAENKKFKGMWIDSMSGNPSRMQGEFDEKTKTLTMMVDSVGPDGQPQKGKHVVVHKDDNTRVFTMYIKMGDDWARMMEITYTRRAEKAGSKEK